MFDDKVDNTFIRHNEVYTLKVMCKQKDPLQHKKKPHICWFTIQSKLRENIKSELIIRENKTSPKKNGLCTMKVDSNCESGCLVNVQKYRVKCGFFMEWGKNKSQSQWNYEIMIVKCAVENRYKLGQSRISLQRKSNRKKISFRSCWPFSMDLYVKCQ